MSTVLRSGIRTAQSCKPCPVFEPYTFSRPACSAAILTRFICRRYYNVTKCMDQSRTTKRYWCHERLPPFQERAGRACSRWSFGLANEHENDALAQIASSCSNLRIFERPRQEASLQAYPLDSSSGRSQRYRRGSLQD